MSSRSPKPYAPAPAPSKPDSLAAHPERKDETVNSVGPPPNVASPAEGKHHPYTVNAQIVAAGVDASARGVVLSDGQAIGETKPAASKPPALQETMSGNEIGRGDAKREGLNSSMGKDRGSHEPRSAAQSGSHSQEDRNGRRGGSAEWRASRRSRERSTSRNRARRRARSRSRSRGDRHRYRSRSRSRGRSRGYARSRSPSSSYDDRRPRRRRSRSSSDDRDYTGYSRRSGRRNRDRSWDRHRSRSSSRSRSRSRSPGRGYYRGSSGSPRRRRGSPGYRRDSPGYRRDSGYRDSYYSSGRNWSPDRRGRYDSPGNRRGHGQRGGDRKRTRGSNDAVLDGSRQMRTVYVWRLRQHVKEADVYDFFSRAGKVRDVQLVMERRLKQHKGSGYVEFFSQDSVRRAVGLAGGLIGGYPVAVKASSDDRVEDDVEIRAGSQPGPSQALNTANTSSGQVPMASVGWSWAGRRPVPQISSAAESKLSGLSGGNGSFSPLTTLVSIPELIQLLNPNNLPVPTSPHGAMISPSKYHAATEHVPLPLAANTAASGTQPGTSLFTRLYIGSVPFEIGEDDLRTIFNPFGVITSLQLQRDPVTGRSRGYGFVEYAEHASAKTALTIDGLICAGRALKVALASQDSRAPAVPRAAGLAASPGALRAVNLREVSGELDEGREGGVLMSASQKASLRERLARGESMVSGANGTVASSSVPSKSLLLGNMFDPSKERAGFEQELEEDVRDECASKYGAVTHLYVDKDSRGFVYIRFASIEICKKAILDLNGRYFDRVQVSAAYVNDAEYRKRFPDAPV